MDYDEFEIGDRVWSEAYGFGIVVDLILEDSVKCRIDDERYIAFTQKGKMRLFEHRPRTFFHAVADGDVGMRAAIAHGKGLRRPGKPKDWDSMLGEYACSEFEKLLVAVLKKTVEWKNMEYILIEHVIKRVNEYASRFAGVSVRPFGADYSILYPSVAALHKIAEEAKERSIQNATGGGVE